MMRKTSFLLIIISILIFSPGVYAQPDGEITVTINSQVLEFDVPPQIINDRTMVPMRKIFESLGAVVTWDDLSQTATGKKGDTVVNISVNSTTLFKNSTPFVLDVAPVLINDRVLVPARAIAESFGCTVDWDDKTDTVIITTSSDIEKPILSATEISEKVAPSVFYIEVYDAGGTPVAMGSGFFISSDGTAVTNYHVIEDTYSAKIATTNGKVYDVENVIAYDSTLDIAIIKVSKTDVEGITVSGFSEAQISNSNNLKAGQTVYAIGSPQGLENTISSGIISNPNRVIDSATYIQTTAAISHGSSGGALVNEYGEVIGITSAGIDDAQNIGFAIPINVINSLNRDSDGISYEEFASQLSGTSGFKIVLSDYELSVPLGDTDYILVGVNGGDVRDDWSIYWEVENENIVEASWGEWLEDYEDVCPLYLKGLAPGKTKVTISSDVNDMACVVDITVTLDTAVQVYAGTSIPTFTSFSGVECYEQDEKLYCYKIHDNSVIFSYAKYLESLGYEFYNYEKLEYGDSYTYINLNTDSYVGLTIATKYGELWLYASTLSD